MTRLRTWPAIFYAMVLLFSAALAMLLLWAFSHPHRPLEFMVAGTLLTTFALLGFFFAAVKRRMF